MEQPRTLRPRVTRTQPIVTRFFARRLWSSESQDTLAGAVAFQRRAYDKAVVLVRAFYAVSVLWMLQSLAAWPRYAGLGRADPLWPAGWWFDWFSIRTGVNLIFGAFVVTSLVVLLFPERRLARIGYAFMLLQHIAFVNGFDKEGHGEHAWLFISVILILLPRGPWTKRRIADRQYFLGVVWMSQLALLFFYGLTGFWKVTTAVQASLDGRISGFNLSGFSYIISSALLRNQNPTVLGHFLARNEFPGWVLYVGTMFLEAGALMVAFRPRLHRLWGVGLILFHIGTQLAMGFSFPENVVVLGLFLVTSPFVPDRIRFKDAVLDLPGIHFISRRIESARRRTASPPKETLGPAVPG